MNNYDKLLRYFADQSSFHDYAQEPFIQGEYVYATDGKICIQIRKDLPSDEFEIRDKPNTLNLFTKEKNQDRIITLEMLKRAMDSIPKANFEKCPACDGTGKVDFEFEFSCKTYTTREECPACGGSGDQHSFSPIPNYKYCVCLIPGENSVKQTYVHQLMWCMFSLEVKSIRVVYYDGYMYTLEISDGVQVAIGASFPSVTDGDLTINI